jgi:hypothetical protein
VAGRFTIEARDGTYKVGEPEVIERAAALRAVSTRARLMFRVFGINRFLKVRRSTEAPGETTGSEETPRGIAAERWEELREFRAAHPLERANVNGVGWSYVAGGAGEEALLLLPGGAMVGEAGFTRIPAFEDRYRVIAPDDLASWPGRVLILESDEDILTPEQRAELRRCYPRAVVHTFRGAGHTPWMSHKKEYLSVINEFLDE